MKTIEEILDDKIKLPTFPAIALRIIDAVKADDASMSELTKIVSSDPALVARVLKISNSSFYSLPQKVDSIQKALTILGTENLKNIALSFVIVNWMKSSSGESFNHETFWKRAVTSAVAADLISAAIDQRSDDIFITALLQDIGIVILHLCLPEEYLRVFDEKRVTALPVAEVEKKLFGYDHQEMGARILEKWGLPEAIYMPIAFHHNTKNSPESFSTKTQILWLSDRMSSIYHGAKCAEQLKDIYRTLQRSYGFNEEDITKIIDAVAEKTVEILSYFEIDAGNMKPYSQLLIDANEALGKLNVSYEQAILELKRSNDRMEILAIELQAANEKLRELATKDGLTGLYNHRHFQEALEKEINRSLRNETPLSLVLMDIDNFKSINDQYGHPVGDIVLKRLAATLQETIRDTDLLARYGGEEFSVILPETDLKGGALLAERLRRAVEVLETTSEDYSIQATISLGVTTYAPSTGSKGMTEFITAADKGLYHSKETGRNKISLVNMSTG